MPGAIDTVPLDSIAHVIQVALTPVFLLSGIGALPKPAEPEPKNLM
jgi:hypothetical protein